MRRSPRGEKGNAGPVVRAILHYQSLNISERGETCTAKNRSGKGSRPLESVAGRCRRYSKIRMDFPPVSEGNNLA